MVSISYSRINSSIRAQVFLNLFSSSLVIVSSAWAVKAKGVGHGDANSLGTVIKAHDSHSHFLHIIKGSEGERHHPAEHGRSDCHDSGAES